MPAFLLSLFSRFGYSLVFVVVALQNAGVPSPGHTVVLGGGFLAQQGNLSLLWVFVAASTAAIVGGEVGFRIGRRYGRQLLDRHRRFLRLTQGRQKILEDHFKKHDAKTILMAKYIVGAQTVIALFAGMSGMRWSRFFLLNVASSIMWSLLYSGLGYAFGSSWDVLKMWMDGTALLVVAVVTAGGVGLVLRRRRVLQG